MPTPLNILFAASSEFALPTLQALRSAGHNILRVYSQPDRPAGRGRKLTPTPIAQYALDHSLDLVRTPDLNAEPLPPADLLIVIAFGQKISEAVTNHPRLGSVNLHASRLPKYRGAAPINWAILSGETQTGNSVIRLAQRMDAGPVLAISRLSIGHLETAGELHDRLAADGAPLMLDVLNQLATGTAVQTPQDEALATKAPKLHREASRIDWSHPAEHIARQIRAMYPWPGCRVALLDETGHELDRLTLVRAKPIAAPPNPLGAITPDQTVAAGAAALEILEVQPQGKRPMPLTSYRNGHPWRPGMRLHPLT